jgi:hypothetical protein
VRINIDSPKSGRWCCDHQVKFWRAIQPAHFVDVVNVYSPTHVMATISPHMVKLSLVTMEGYASSPPLALIRLLKWQHKELLGYLAIFAHEETLKEEKSRIMKRIAVILAFLFVGVFAHAQKTLSGIQVSPHGAAMHSGTLQFSAACSYTDGSTDNCSGETVSWYSSQPSLDTVSSSGLATYVTNCGPGDGTQVGPFQQWQCWANIVATVNGFSDYATIFNQYPTDTFQVVITPGLFYNPTRTSTLAVGSTATFGAGDSIDNRISKYGANPFPGCNWTSSNTSVGTINRYGFFTAVSSGTAVVTCVTAGNAAYTADASIPTAATVPATYSVTVVNGGVGGNTWYVRPDGGTPYTNATNTPVGQCNGLANAAYPGSGVNQPCAFGDFEDLYFDQVTETQQWVINGGDTVIVYPKTTGYNTAIITASPVTPTNCDGDYTYCDVPAIPSGTTAQPTRILGSNYSSCTGSYGPNSSMTTLLLGYGREAIRTDLSQNIDVECFEIADGSSTTGFYYGVWSSAFTSNATFKNIFIHNAARSGVFGASGLGMAWDHMHVRAAAQTGFNMDDAPYGISDISVAGGLTMTNSDIEFTGCREIYGSTAQYPFIANSCLDENESGGQGDGMGTAAMTGTWYYNNDIFRYNFQDGLDNLHSGAQSETVINSQAYGNDGQQFKFGDVDTGIFQNNFALGNCTRIMQPFNGVTIANPGVVPCRAGGGALLFEWANTGSYTFQNNTLIGVGNVTLMYQCEVTWASCSGSPTTLENNIFAGYTDPDKSYNSGAQAAAFYEGSSGLPASNNGWAVRSNNDFYNVAAYTPLLTGELAVDPLFIGEPPFLTELSAPAESVLGNYNFMPSSSSPMLGAGVYLAGLTTDATGVTRPNPPAIGALEAASGNTQSAPQITLTATPNPVTVGQSVTLSASVASVNGVMPTGTVIFSSNGTSLGSGVVNSAGTATLTVSLSAAGSDALTATYSGDATYAPGASPALSLTVNPAPALATTTLLQVSSNPITAGQAVTLTATVVAGSGGNPSGVVSLVSNGVLLGTASLNSAGVATLSTASMAAGSYSMTAQYGGNSSFDASTSSPLSETVTAAGVVAGINVTASTPTLTIGSGSSTSDAEALTLTAVGGYSGTITMACANLPSGSTCSFQPQTVSVSAATSPVTVVMTIQNSGTSTAASLGMHRLIMHDTTLAAIFWIPGLFASALIGKKRKLLFQARFLLLLLSLGGVFGGLTGCGSSSYTAITQAAQTTQFQVMVTGTGNVIQTINLAVTMQ